MTEKIYIRKDRWADEHGSLPYPWLICDDENARSYRSEGCIHCTDTFESALKWASDFREAYGH